MMLFLSQQNDIRFLQLAFKDELIFYKAS